MFLISQIKLIERTQNLKVDLNIELRSTVLFINFYQQRGIMEQLNYFHAGKCATEIIPSYLVILPRLKISMAANRAIFKHD